MGFVTQSSVKAELLVSVVRVIPDPALAQIYFGGGGADGNGGSEELHWEEGVGLRYLQMG